MTSSSTGTFADTGAFANSGTFVDSCVLLDLFTDDPRWKSWSLQQLKEADRRGPLIINPVVYTEISIGFSRIEILESLMDELEIETQAVPKPAAFLAGKAFKAYLERGSSRTAPLPDFFIGAHAAVLGIPLLTRDPKRMQQVYPTLKVICP